MAEKKSIVSVVDGVGFGAALAIAISWSVNESIMWAMLHGFCSWFYVFFYWMGWAENG